MSTPLAKKTTISSRNKLANQHQLNRGQDIITTTATTTNNHHPTTGGKFQRPDMASSRPSQIARHRDLKTPAPANSSSISRLASLANGLPPGYLNNRDVQAMRNNAIGDHQGSMSATPATRMSFRSVTTSNNHVQPLANNNNSSHINKNHINTKSSAHQSSSSTTRLPPYTTAKTGQKVSGKAAIPATVSRITAPNSRLISATPVYSRSSSVVSSASSAKPSIALDHIPETTTMRKGLAKFSNPIECQRQFHALSLKVRQKDEILEAREKEIERLQEQLKRAVDMGVGYASIVQYFAVKLKLDSEVDLLKECENLKSRVSELLVNEKEYDIKLEAIVDDYKNHLQVEHDLRNNIERELQETREAHSQVLKKLESTHKDELDDLKQNHSLIETELRTQVESLESELESKCKDLSELRKEHEVLTNSYNKLEESLTKDKDARVKYAQEKISQLQKDVESLNSVLEMRLEKIHALEKDSLLLGEVRNELITYQDANKALHQQLESVNAALDRRREQFENLLAEHEKLRQELKRERKERRRMTMRTEQLEYVLNESCASESNMVFNPSMRDLDSADHLV